MKAKNKVISNETAESLGIKSETTFKTVRTELPSTRKTGMLVTSVDELLEKLKNGAKII